MSLSDCIKCWDTPCPCSLCIIKTMCDNTCDEYEDWRLVCINEAAAESKSKHRTL